MAAAPGAVAVLEVVGAEAVEEVAGADQCADADDQDLADLEAAEKELAERRAQGRSAEASTMTADLVAFLRARLDEDEQTARAAASGPWIRHEHVAGVHVDDAAEGRIYRTAVADCRRVRDGYGVPNALHIVRHQPARVLAEVEAKRQIVDAYAAILKP